MNLLISNPPRRRKSRKHRHAGRKRRRSAAQRAATRRMLAAARSSRKGTHHKKHRRRRRRHVLRINSGDTKVKRSRRSSGRRRRRGGFGGGKRRGFIFMPDKALLKDALYAGGGLVVPGMISDYLSTPNALTGKALVPQLGTSVAARMIGDAAATVIGASLLGKFAGQREAGAFAIGGLANLAAQGVSMIRLAVASHQASQATSGYGYAGYDQMNGFEQPMSGFVEVQQ